MAGMFSGIGDLKITKGGSRILPEELGDILIGIGRSKAERK